MSADVSARIAERLGQHGVVVVASELEALSAYYTVLYKWNARMNLTALRDGADALDRLIVEPVLASRLMPESAQHLDVGSGGGSPALPLRAMRAGFRSCLVESRTRKVAFLREAARCMRLGHVRVEACRVEDLQPPPTLFSLVTVRAVRLDGPLVAAIERLIAPSASLWYFAGPNEAFEAPGGAWTRVRDEELVGEKQSRVVCFTWNSASGVSRGTA